jgi:hypothetical protein
MMMEPTDDNHQLVLYNKVAFHRRSTTLAAEQLQALYGQGKIATSMPPI